MKKFAVALLASFALIQSVQALPSALNQSIREYNAIETSDLLREAISEDQAIIDIARKTKNLDAKIVFYEIKTISPAGEEAEKPAVDTISTENEVAKARPRDITRRYVAKLKIKPNPEIGPVIITVVSIEPIVKDN